MTTKILTDITISAPAQHVWNMLVNVDNYETWNPFFIKGSGIIQTAGEKLSLQLSNGKIIKPTVKVFDIAKELRWDGAILGNWFFGGSHYFYLKSVNTHTTLVTHGEDFWGLIPKLMPSFIHKIKLDYQKVNDSLKQHCEAQVQRI